MKCCYLACLFLTIGTSICRAQAPPTIAQALAKEGLGTSNKELRTALRSSDPNIRSLAAGQLAENGDLGAIPLLLEALQRERDLSVRLNIARALNVFNNPEGTETMVQLCTDRSARNDLRIVAAEDLSSRGNESCFASVVKILSSSKEPAERQAALSFIEHAHKETIKAYDPESLAEACGHALGDGVSSIRQSAADCIGLYDLVQDASSLRSAAESETDPDTKKIMRDAEQRLAVHKSNP